MANFKSEQITKVDAVPSERLPTVDYTGRQRLSHFKFTAPAGGLAASDTIELCEVPAGSRIIGGNITHGALGASRTIDIGISGALTKYLAAADVSSAGATPFANTQARNYGTITGKKERLILTLSGGTMAQDLVFQGHVSYAAD